MLTIVNSEEYASIISECKAILEILSDVEDRLKYPNLTKAACRKLQEYANKLAEFNHC